jgi:hypothetical protein
MGASTITSTYYEAKSKYQNQSFKSIYDIGFFFWSIMIFWAFTEKQNINGKLMQESTKKWLDIVSLDLADT